MRRHGFMLADAMIGLAVVGVLGTVLVVALGEAQRAREKLADTRAAQRLAEATLISLQVASPRPAPGGESSVQIRRLDAPSPVKGQAWIEVEAKVRGRPASLTGLAPQVAPATTQGGRP